MNPYIPAITTIAALLAVSCTGLMTRQDRSVTELESELSVLKKRITMVENKNALLEAENGDHKTSIRRIKNDYTVLKNQSDARIRELSLLNTRLQAEYIGTASRLSDIIAGLEKKLSEKSEDLSKKDAAVKELQAAADLLKTELNKKDEAIASSEKKYRALLSEIEKSKTSLEENAILLKERDKTISALKSEINALHSSLNGKTSEITLLRSKLDSLESKKIDQK